MVRKGRKKAAKDPGTLPGMPCRPRSEAIIAFLECLIVPSGKGQGEPFRLEEWQKQFIRDVYDPVYENEKGERIRQIRRALLSIGRKNGKTALAAGLVLVHLLGPEAKRNGEVYSAATDRNQAGHIFKCCRQMIEADPELTAMCGVFASVKRIVCYHLGSAYQALSADARRQHGFNPSFVIYDELAQAIDRELYDVLQTSFGAQEEALMLVISTQSPDNESVMSELCDDAIEQAKNPELRDPTFYGKVFAVPDDADPLDETKWHLANPALGVFRSMADMRSLALKAAKSPDALNTFRNLYLNQRVSTSAGLVNSLDWKACQGDFDHKTLAGNPFCGSLDLSQRTDLTCFTGVWKLPDGRKYVKSWFWCPENFEEKTGDEALLARGKRDGARYLEWQNAGWLFVTPGKVVDYAKVIEFVAKLLRDQGDNLIAVAYDRWRIEQFKRELELAGENPEKWHLVEHGQAFRDMTPAIDALETLTIQHQLVHDGNPCLTYCMSNIRVAKDPAGGRKFDKRQRNRRIDGAVCLAMGLNAESKAEPQEKKGPSVYETRRIRVFG